MASLAAIAQGPEETVQPPPPETYRRRPDGAVEISELWRILWHRRAMILAVAGLLTGLALAYGLATSPLYTASTQILIDPRDRNVVNNDVNPSTVSPDGGLAQIESQTSVIQSGGVLIRAIRATRLAEDSEFNGAGLLSRLLGRVVADPPTTDGSLTPAEARTLANLRRRVSVKRADKVFVVDVAVTTKEAGKSAKLANAIAEAYLADQADSRSRAATEASEALTARLDEQRKRVEAAENAVERYRAEHNLVAASGRLISDQQLSEISNQLSIAQARTAALKSQVEQLAQQRARGGLAGTSSEAVQSSVIGRLREQEATLIQREADLQSQFGPRHPAIGAVQNQVAHLRRMIAVEIERVAQSVRTDYERALGNEKLLSDKLEALTRQTQGADKASVRLRELQRDLDAVKAVYANFLLRAQETREQASLDTTNARIISLAQLPLQPSWPPTGLLAAAAAALGLGLGMGLALLREYAVPRLLSPAQAEAMIGAPVIAVLPSGKPAPARRRWNLGGSGASAGNAEADAGLALLRLFNSGPASATAARSLLVTSASSGDSERERVTDLLAAAAIRQGERVLLIDANVERGQQDAGRGLMDILRGESSLDEAIQFEGGKDVALMSGGRRKAPPQKALGRSFAMRMLADASRHFDVVIADAGALTTNVTIAPLVGMAEEIVLVAQLHETRLADVAKAVEAARIMGRAVTATILVEPGGRG